MYMYMYNTCKYRLTCTVLYRYMYTVHNKPIIYMYMYNVSVGISHAHFEVG